MLCSAVKNSRGVASGSAARADALGPMREAMSVVLWPNNTSVHLNWGFNIHNEVAQ